MERADKVEETVGEIAGDYERLMRGMQKWKAKSYEGQEVAGPSAPRDRGKRKVLADEGDEDEEMETPKRARSEAL